MTRSEEASSVVPAGHSSSKDKRSKTDIKLSLGSSNQKNRFTLVAGGIVIAAIIVALGLALSNQSSNDIGTQQALGTLRSIQASDFMRLHATMSGQKVSGNQTQEIDLYVKSSSISLDDVLEIDSFVTYVEEQFQYNITLINGAGYYVIQNLTDSEIIGVNCVNQEDVPPLATAAASLIAAVVIDDDAEASTDLKTLLSCNEGTIMETSWASEDFVFCVVYDTVGEEYRISQAAANNMHVAVEYLTEDAVPAFVIEQLSISEPISVPNMMNPDEDEVCPTLDLNEFEDPIISSIQADSTTRHLLAQDKDSSSSKRKWYQKSGVLANHPASVGRRRALFTSYNFIVQTTVEEFDTFNTFATNTLGCTYFCGPPEYGHMEIPLASLYDYVSVSDPTNFRKLQDSGNRITLPRPCVMVHGAGYQDVEEMTRNRQRKGNRAGLYTNTGSNYFGKVHESPPCYCSSMHFVELDTVSKEWYNKELQVATCRSIAMVTLGSDNVDTDEDNVAAIKNTVVFTHFTSSFTLGAALAQGYCTFDDSSKWATIHTPVGGLEFATNVTESTEGQATLCNQKNLKKLKNKFNKKYKKGYEEVVDEGDEEARLDYWDELKPMLRVKVAGGYTLKDVYEACSHQDQDPEWINKLNPMDYPYNVEAMYKKSMEKIGEHASAALCGTAKAGLMCSKRYLNSYTQQLAGISSEESDGITPLQSCLAMANINGGKAFSKNPTNRFFRTNSYNTDLNRFRDGWSGSTSKVKTWVDNLRLHEDL